MKGITYSVGTSGSRLPRRTRLVWALTIALLIINILMQFNRSNISLHFWKQSVKNSSQPFNWSDITPSTSLKWVPCFNDFECARLDVPLDWTQSTKHKHKRAAIALARLPARVPVTDPRYGGAILLNPGGPGGSGVFLALLTAHDSQFVADSPIDPSDPASFAAKAKYFDIIGFDPRGVNNTTPRAYCFPDDVTATLFALEDQASGFVNSNESFVKAWARTSAMAQSCNERIEGVAEFVGTRTVVEDMRAIVDALGEWRSNQKGGLDKSTMPEHKEKVLFWGFSYGTLLGATFATVYPNRIERMILDGVVDAEDYYSATWLSNLMDADSILEKFFEECYKAGADCAVYSSSGIDAIRRTYYDSVESLLDNPLPVPAYGNYGPQIITHDDLMAIVNVAIRAPRGGFSTLALIIQDVAIGGGRLMSMIKHLSVPNMCPSPLCKPWSKECHDESKSLESTITFAVLCSDGTDITDRGRDFHWQKWQQLQNQSKILGGMWSQLTMPCSNWKFRSVWNFTDPIEAPNGTSIPILWMSNTRDPVTPLRNARAMAAKFPGSVVFGQDANGHCSLAEPSTCVGLGIRKYFQTGEPPLTGLSCKPDRGPFDLRPNSAASTLHMNLSKSLEQMSKARGRFNVL